MSNFEVETPQSVLDQIHLLYIKELFGSDTKKRIARGNQKQQRTVRPFIVYDLVWEDSYKPHQVMKKYETYLDSVVVSYKIPMQFTYQYTLVFADNDPSCATITQKLFRYLLTDRFKNAIKRLNVEYNVLTNLKENNIPIQGFKDRQFQIQIRYDWSDLWTDYDPDSAVESIDTVEVEQEAVPEGA